MALSENLGVPEDNIEAIRKFRDTLLDLKDNYINELPEKRINFEMKNYYSFKCRTNWWQRLSGDLDYFGMKISDENILKKINSIWEYFKKVFPKEHYSGVLHEKKEKFRTKEELDTIDQFLTELIDELDNLLTK